MYLYINLQQRIQCRKNTLYSRGQRPTPPPPPGPASSTSTHETEGRRAQTPTQDLSFPIRTGCQRGPQPECRTHAAQPSAPCPQTGRPSGTHLRRAGTVGSLCPAARGATTLTRPQRPQRFPGSPSEGSPTSSSACLPARLPARRPQALSTTWHHPEPQNRGVGLSKGEGCDPARRPRWDCAPLHSHQRSRGWRSGFTPWGDLDPQRGPRGLAAATRHWVLVPAPSPPRRTHGYLARDGAGG